jgi:hypothetical protein
MRHAGRNEDCKQLGAWCQLRHRNLDYQRNKHDHRKGANVKITDYPLIQRMKAALNGEDTIANILKYDAATPNCAGPQQVCDYDFITDLALNGAGVVNASTIARGVVEATTQIEAASYASGHHHGSNH